MEPSNNIYPNIKNKIITIKKMKTFKTILIIERVFAVCNFSKSSIKSFGWNVERSCFFSELIKNKRTMLMKIPNPLINVKIIDTMDKIKYSSGFFFMSGFLKFWLKIIQFTVVCIVFMLKKAQTTICRMCFII